MEKEIPAVHTDKFQTAFDSQTDYDPAIKTYTTRCGVCGKTVSERKRWFQSRDGTLTRLRLNFNYCDACGRWICGDCYLVYDKDGNSVISCTDCANKRGVTGLTNKQFNEAWPDIERHWKEKRKAKERLEQKQKNREQP